MRAGVQSGSRGALFSLGLTALGLMAASIAFAPRRVLLFAGIAAVVFAGRAAFDSMLLNQISYVLERFETSFTFEADPSIAGSADSRAYLLAHNLNLPGLFFLGVEGFDAEAYPHNFEVEAFVRLGVPLGALFLCAVIYLLWKAARMLSDTRLDIGCAVILATGLFTFANAQTNMMWEMLRPLWLALGVALGGALIHWAHCQDSGAQAGDRAKS